MKKLMLVAVLVLGCGPSYLDMTKASLEVGPLPDQILYDEIVAPTFRLTVINDGPSDVVINATIAGTKIAPLFIKGNGGSGTEGVGSIGGELVVTTDANSVGPFTVLVE